VFGGGDVSVVAKGFDKAPHAKDLGEGSVVVHAEGAL
jgi:hypothetical protein